MLAGCSSTPPSPTVAVAVTQARQRMTEAARLVQQGNWPAAARAWQDVGDRFALLDDLASQAQALHHLARVQRELGDLARSHALLEQASALCAETRSSNAGWLAQIELVQVEFLMRQTNAARQRLEILATQQHAMADPHTRGLLLNELGLDQQRRGALDSAALSYQQARAAFRQAKSDAGLAAVACNQAQVHMDQGQPARAVPLWQQALERYRMLGDVRRIAYCLLGQGEAILAAGRDLVAAEKNLRQAAENYRLLQHHEGRIRSLESLAACLQRQQKESLAAAVRHDLEALRRRP